MTSRTVPLHPSLWIGLDRLKALCVFGMLLAHGFYWVGTASGRVLIGHDDALFPWVEATGLVVGILPVLLAFCAGVASRWQMTDDQINNAPLGQFVWTAVVLYSLNGFMNWAAAGPGVLWAWNVLALVAVGYLTLGLLLRAGASPVVVATTGLGLLLIGDPLRTALGIEGSDPAVLRIIFGDPRDWHTWPIFPWLSTFLLGFAIGDARIRCRHPRQWFAGAALVLLSVAAVAGELGQPFDPNEISGPEVMVPSSMRVLGLMGIALMLLALLDWGRLLRHGPVHCLSAAILPIYLTHLIVGHRVSMAFPTSLRQELLEPDRGASRVVLLLAGPLLLFAFSWLIGYLWLQVTGRRIHIRLRRVT